MLSKGSLEYNYRGDQHEDQDPIELLETMKENSLSFNEKNKANIVIIKCHSEPYDQKAKG